MNAAKKIAHDEMIAALAEFDSAAMRVRYSSEAMADLDAAEKRLEAAEMAYEAVR